MYHSRLIFQTIGPRYSSLSLPLSADLKSKWKHKNDLKSINPICRHATGSVPRPLALYLIIEEQQKIYAA